MNKRKEMFEIQPRLRERPAGGWLAHSPTNGFLKIGVIAPTETEAREKFSQVLREWIRILEQKEV